MVSENIEVKIIRKSSAEEEEQKLKDAFYPKPKCPDCGGEKFLKGPRGCLSINIKCANPACGSKFNICPPMRSIERI
jgi:hypothetical protein